jgi:hypothetical protein
MLAFALAMDVACAPQKESTRPAAAKTRTPQRTTSDATLTCEDRLLANLRAAFQRENPKLTQVGVLDLKAWDFVGPRVVLGWAIVPDHVFRGDFKDEMFGVFVVNDSLSRVERVVDTFATPRWLDYEVRFGRLTGDSVEVLGRGATYSDGPMRRWYKWW